MLMLLLMLLVLLMLVLFRDAGWRRRRCTRRRLREVDVWGRRWEFALGVKQP
jgi:hypothetical protein